MTNKEKIFIKKVYEYLASVIKQGGFLNIPHLFDIAKEYNCELKLVAAITNKGTGKTTSCMETMLKSVARHQKQGV
ncbi:MAG: hypothetical protein HUJ68_00145 [Clostridia bacterium]|nr:hypothetical protein [Clostridia bacterium]